MKLTVYQDTREKRPLTFPDNIVLSGKLHQVVVEKVELPIGDYCLSYNLDSEGPDGIIERKGSIDELYQNLFTKDRARFMRSLDRVRDSGVPCYLLLDFKWWADATSNRTTVNAESVLDALWDVVVRYNLHPIALGDYPQGSARTRLGGHLLRLLYVHRQQRDRQRLRDSLEKGLNDGPCGSEDAPGLPG